MVNTEAFNSVVILDAFEKENNIEKAIKKILQEKAGEFSYFKLKDMNIRRCTACGSCVNKTPGKCILNDDMQEVFKAIAKSQWIIMLTSLSFGSYSSTLKKVVDRFMVLGLPFYFVKDGYLFHKTRYGHKNLLGIALAEETLQGQGENFRKILARNGANLQYTDKALIFKPSDNMEKIEREIRSVLIEM